MLSAGTNGIMRGFQSFLFPTAGTRDEARAFTLSYILGPFFIFYFDTGSHYVAQAGLEFVNLLIQPSRLPG